MLVLSSPAFPEDGAIPLRHSGRGEDLSPPFSIAGLPEGTASLALLLEDTSHPLFRDFTHWLLWDIPPVDALPEGLPHGERVDLPGGAAVQGMAYGPHRYAGPKPPRWRRHRYRFTLLALDCKLGLPAGSRKKALLRAAQGHILEQAVLNGWFPGKPGSH